MYTNQHSAIGYSFAGCVSCSVLVLWKFKVSGTNWRDYKVLPAFTPANCPEDHEWQWAAKGSSKAFTWVTHIRFPTICQKVYNLQNKYHTLFWPFYVFQLIIGDLDHCPKYYRATIKLVLHWQHGPRWLWLISAITFLFCFHYIFSTCWQSVLFILTSSSNCKWRTAILCLST
jgi:hypothetical protein